MCERERERGEERVRDEDCHSSRVDVIKLF